MSLAIVIPAYKAAYLEKTLHSILEQSCRDFTLYICDDASPDDIIGTVKPFIGKLDLKYKRFEENAGGKDLVLQWERSISLCKEEYIWLFSDDDIMPSDAVERFYKVLSQNPGAQFFRFPLSWAADDGSPSREFPPLPQGVSSAKDLLSDINSMRRQGAAIEYVFSRELFSSLKMIHFPLAWCSDTATFYNYANHSAGVVNIPGAPVLWRAESGANISSNTALSDAKMDALILFVSWLKDNYEGPFDKRFSTELRTLIETNLHYSFNRNYSARKLWALCKEYYAIDRYRAIKLFVKSLIKRHAR